MPQHLDPEAHNLDDRAVTIRARIIFAEGLVRRMREHNLSDEQNQLLECGLTHCRSYLRNPNGYEHEESVIRFLNYLNTFPLPCHPGHHKIRKIINATRSMADWRARNLPVSDEDMRILEGLDEYGDIFEWLTSVLRCPVCFEPGYFCFNQLDNHTGLEFDWADMAGILEGHSDFDPPVGYTRIHQLRPRLATLRDSPFAHALVPDLKSACECLHLDFQAVAWQIVRYAIDLETPSGPKRLLRRSQWAELAAHTHETIRLIDPDGSMYRYPNPEDVLPARTMISMVECVQFKWFDEITGTSDCRVNDRVIELHHQIAATGRAELGGARNLPLFDLDDLDNPDTKRDIDKVKSRPFWEDSYSLPSSNEPGAANQSSNDNTDGNANGVVNGNNIDIYDPDNEYAISDDGDSISLIISEPEGQVEPAAATGRGLREFFYLSARRAKAILSIYTVLLSCYENPCPSADDTLILLDLELTLQRIIRYPDYYTDDFIENLTQCAGLSIDELRTRGMLRLKYLGLVSIVKFDGLFEARLERIPDNAFELITTIVNALRNDNVRLLRRLPIPDPLAIHNPLVYNKDLAYPVLRALADMRELSNYAGIHEFRARRKRKTDLSRVFHRLIRNKVPTSEFGPIDIQAVIQTAGDDDGDLRIECLKRVDKIGPVPAMDLEYYHWAER